MFKQILAQVYFVQLFAEDMMNRIKRPNWMKIIWINHNQLQSIKHQKLVLFILWTRRVFLMAYKGRIICRNMYVHLNTCRMMHAWYNHAQQANGGQIDCKQERLRYV
eukprot:217173_1